MDWKPVAANDDRPFNAYELGWMTAEGLINRLVRSPHKGSTLTRVEPVFPDQQGLFREGFERALMTSSFLEARQMEPRYEANDHTVGVILTHKGR